MGTAKVAITLDENVLKRLSAVVFQSPDKGLTGH
jgi:hypothetical protein